MSGPLSAYSPHFPEPFLQAAQQMASKRTVAYQLRQRAELVVLLHTHPTLSNGAAGNQVRLPPNTVRHWRRRWANGEFTLEDQTGRGRKARFSPSGQDDC